MQNNFVVAVTEEALDFLTSSIKISEGLILKLLINYLENKAMAKGTMQIQNLHEVYAPHDRMCYDVGRYISTKFVFKRLQIYSVSLFRIVLLNIWKTTKFLVQINYKGAFLF